MAVVVGLVEGARPLRRSRTGPSRDVVLDLPDGVGRREALETALRQGIRSGRLRAGTVLPSSRSLAADLGFARGTVTGVYEQLVAEGWLVTRPGATTAVAVSPVSYEPVSAQPSRTFGPRHDFHPGLPDLDAFPRRTWVAALRRALTDHPDADIWCHDVQGHPELRARLLEYLGRARGVVGSPDDLVVCSGFTQGFALVATTLRRRGVHAVAVEDPCRPLNRDALAAEGLEVVPVPVDEQGLRVDHVPPTVGAVVVTPGLHFPTGVVLSPDRRRALVTHATQHDVWVIEDDYASEHRYKTAPLPALQSQAPDHVVHAHSVGKALTPGLRLGWLVLPAALRLDLVAAKLLADKGTSALDQLAFSEMLASGAFSRHIRGQRARYRRRRDHVVTVLQRRVPSVRVQSPDAGLFIVVELPPGSSEAQIMADATSRDMRLVSITPCWLDRSASRPMLAVGIAATPDHRFRAAVEELAKLLADHAGLPLGA